MWFLGFTYWILMNHQCYWLLKCWLDILYMTVVLILLINIYIGLALLYLHVLCCFSFLWVSVGGAFFRDFYFVYSICNFVKVTQMFCCCCVSECFAWFTLLLCRLRRWFIINTAAYFDSEATFSSLNGGVLSLVYWRRHTLTCWFRVCGNYAWGLITPWMQTLLTVVYFVF